VRVLAGDIGGTNTRLAVIEEREGRLAIITRLSRPSREVGALPPLIEELLTGQERPSRACLGIAGPVIKGRVRTTNLPWLLDQDELAGAIGIPSTTLINDFAAIGEGLPFLAAGDFTTLQQGIPEPQGPIALIGAGTGLGEGLLFHEEGRYRAHPSEGGHTSFAARTPREWEVYRQLERRFGAVSWERVVSGPGLVSVYHCLGGSSSVQEPGEVSERGLGADDPAAAETLRIFAGAYGAETGNLALTVLATGGVYLAGGIAPRLIGVLREGTFMEAFRRKGELEPFLARVPVMVIMNPDAGLLGAGAAAIAIEPERAARPAP
jgi:glucokinase